MLSADSQVDALMMGWLNYLMLHQGAYVRASA